MSINELYNNEVLSLKDQFLTIEIDQEKVEKIRDFTEKLVEKKKNEEHHKSDARKHFKRFFNGFIGEAALESLLNINIIDWSIGDSSTHHKPDIPGFKVGIKTVEEGKFPIIFKDNWYPQIICIINKEPKNSVSICGIANTDILNKYQSVDLILDSNLVKRGSKTGFYGFRHLQKLTSIEDIKKYKKG